VAAAGFLCVYARDYGSTPTARDNLIVKSVSTSGNALIYSTFTNVSSVAGDGRADAWGFQVQYQDNGSPSQADGTWAVTTP
jgi:hypothetical protein